MRVAVPNKGRLHEPSVDLLERAGLPIESTADRKLYVDTVDPDVSVLFARAADIPEYVRDGAAPVGITGRDQVVESGANLTELVDLEFGRCRLVLAAPEGGTVNAPGDLTGGSVATEFPRITREYLDREGIDADVVEVTGATELTPHVDMADAIVDITSTGTTLRMNRLAVIDEVLQSSVRLYAHPDHVDDAKIQQLVTAFESVLAAEDKRYVMMNAPEDRLGEIREVIPGLDGPTVMDVAGDDTVAVHAVIDERDIFETVDELKSVGASGILVTEIGRLVE
jgi:ATP phosphoribosyltransferase